MVKVPYVVVGFDVDKADPNAAVIMADVRDGFPPVGLILPGGPENVFAVETTAPKMIALRNQIAGYLATKDALHGGKLRRCVFLMRINDGIIT